MDIFGALQFATGFGLLLSFTFLFLLIKQLPHRIDPALGFSSALLFYASSGIFVQLREFGEFVEFGTRFGPIAPEHMLEGYLLIVLFIGLLVAARVLFPNLFTIPVNDFKATFNKLLDNDLAYLATLFALTAFIVFAIATNQFGYMGTVAEQGTEDIETYGQIGVVGYFAGPIVFFMCLLAGAKFARPVSPWLGALTFAIALVPLSFIGRRNLIIGLFLVLVGLIMSRPRKEWRFTDVAVGGALAVVAAFGFVFFFALRREVNEDRTLTVETFSQAWTATVDPDSNPNYDLYEQTEENVKGRLLGPVTMMAEMAREPDSLPGAQGTVLVYSIGSAIPRAIWRDKGLFTAQNPSEEVIVFRQFPGVSEVDHSNTVISSGYTDYREAGVILYAGLFAVILVASVGIVRYSPTPMLKLFLLANLLSTVLSVEQGLNNYVLMFRSFLIILVIEFVVLSYLNHKKPEARLQQASYTN